MNKQSPYSPVLSVKISFKKIFFSENSHSFHALTLKSSRCILTSQELAAEVLCFAPASRRCGLAAPQAPPARCGWGVRGAAGAFTGRCARTRRRAPCTVSVRAHSPITAEAVTLAPARLPTLPPARVLSSSALLVSRSCPRLGKNRCLGL